MSLIAKVVIALKEESNPDFADWYDHLCSRDKSMFESELEQTMLKVVVQQMARRKQRWPKVGEKIKAIRSIDVHWFRNVIENSKKLKIGETYTVKTCDPASSWCPIEIEEIEGTFCLSCFEWKY